MAKPQRFEPLTRSFDLSRSSINEDARTVDVVFSTETDKVERWFGVEILDHSPKAVRMERLNNAAPLLLDHSSRDQIGVIESASIAGKTGTATVRFSKSARGEEMFQDVKDGIRSKVSVGYRVHDLKMERSDKKTGKDTYRVTDWEPFEISLVSIPADDSAGVREGASIFGQRAAELSTSIDMENNQDNTEDRAANAPAPAANVPAETQVESRAAQVDKQLSEIEIRQLADSRASEIANAEIQRREDIRAYGERFKLPKEDVDKAIKEKRSVDEFKLSILERVGNLNPAYSVAAVEENNAPEAGTRAAMLTSFAQAAKPVLAARGINIHIPDYAARQDVVRNYIDNGGDQFHRSMSGAVTLLDVAKLDAGIGYPLISEVAVLAPETRVFPVDVINGASVELSVNVTSATVGFRNANEGTSPSIGTFESRLFQTQVIEHPIVVDIQGVLNAAKDPARVMESTARTVLDGVVKHIGFQTWYGATAQSGTDAKAAPGLLAQSSTAATHVVDADGSTALTSVYMARLGDASCDMVFGNGTTLNMGEWMEETVESAAGKKLRALVAYISGRVAPRLANKNALVRIKKVGTDSGKKLTDLLLFSAYEKFVTLGQEPNAIFMGPRSLEQLRASRTATNPNGAPAPIPTDWNGIPIYLTNSLSLAETV
jgi:HK97 family phage prohead protease